MSFCPRCAGPLQNAKIASRNALNCPSCGGTAVNLSVLRNEKTRAILVELWKQSESRPAGGLLCPGCEKPMREVFFIPAEKARALSLDLCRTCQMMWFDAREFECWPQTKPELSIESEQAVAKALVEAQAEFARLDPTARLQRDAEAEFDRILRVGRTVVEGGPFGLLSPWTWGKIVFDEIREIIDNVLEVRRLESENGKKEKGKP